MPQNPITPPPVGAVRSPSLVADVPTPQPRSWPVMEPSLPTYAKPGPYVTTLSPAEETAFTSWVQQNKVPWLDEPKADYDMRGFWKAQQSGDPGAQRSLNPNDNAMHFPDTYKTPYHKSFSNESQYATADAPYWNSKDQLVDKDGRVVFDERAATPPARARLIDVRSLPPVSYGKPKP